MLSDRGDQFKAHHLHGEAEYQYLARRLEIDLRYARKPRTKGKIENQFRFVQRDFALKNLHQDELDALHAAWAQWMQWDQLAAPAQGVEWGLSSGSLRALPAPPDPRRPGTPTHPRGVPQGHTHRPYQLLRAVLPRSRSVYRRRVWAILQGETLGIECGQQVIATHPIKTDHLRVFPRDS